MAEMATTPTVAADGFLPLTADNNSYQQVAPDGVSGVCQPTPETLCASGKDANKDQHHQGQTVEKTAANEHHPQHIPAGGQQPLDGVILANGKSPPEGQSNGTGETLNECTSDVHGLEGETKQQYSPETSDGCRQRRPFQYDNETEVSEEVPPGNRQPTALVQIIKEAVGYKEWRRPPSKWQCLRPGPGDALFLYVANSLLYLSLKYTMPHYLREYDGWTIYYGKVLTAHLYINIMANWLCTKCYDSFVPVTRDRAERDEDIARAKPGDEDDEKKRLSWRYCDKCEIDIPPRAFHCQWCNWCIVKRDHHCNYLGVCIGYWNQRFFWVLSFWVMVGCALGEYLIIIYLKDIYFPTRASYWEILFPVTIYNFIFADVSLDHLIMISLTYLLLVGVSRGCNFFNVQTLVITSGKTSFEEFKHVRVRVRTSLSKNLQSVLGPYWAINFLFPANIIFPQSGDGTKWDGVSIY